MTDLANRISALSPGKQQLLEMLRKKGAPSPAAPARTEAKPRLEPFALVSEADRAKLPPDLEDAYPLTMVQLGMLYHMELTPDASTPAYHNVNSFHLRAPLDLPMFDAIVQRVIARHPILRTSFDLTGYSEPLQLVHRSAYLPIEHEDLRDLPVEEQRDRLRDFILEENRRLVDLSHPPLIRFHIHRRSDASFQFTLTEPHAISDGWSTMLTLTEIFDAYFALLAGKSLPPEPPATASFRDYVHLERQALQSEETRRFWREKIATAPLERLPRLAGSILEDPVMEDPVQPHASPEDHKPTVDIPAEVLERLEKLSRLAETPLKSVLVAAHVKVMGMLAGSPEVMTGLTTHGRPEESDGAEVRGLFLNTLPFVFHLPPGESWLSLVKRVFQAELELMPHRRYPLAALQRLRGGQTLFESAFSYLHFHSVRSVVQPGKLELSGEGTSDLSVTHFPLAATFVRDPIQELAVSLTIEKNDPGISLAQLRSLQGYYLRVLAAMAADTEAPHDAGDYLSAEERQQVLAEWSGPGLDFAVSACLQERFAAQAAERPEAAAVVCGEERLTYAELDRRANHLGHRLRALGVGPEVRVGICLERSAAIPVALLGVLKAGGVYLPLDPAYPAARLEYLLSDSQAGVLITERSLEGRLPGFPGEILWLEEDTKGAEAPPVSGTVPENAAYVIYTSGSTGNPKGVVVSHARVMRLFAATDAWFGFGPGDVWTLFHSYAFDFSVWEIWGALLNGGRLVVVPYLVSRSPEAFRDLLAREGVTVLNQTPSAFRQLIAADEGRPDDLALRLVIFGGEALDPRALAPWIARHGDQRPRLINMYGITETTVHVTYRPVTAADTTGNSGSRIGQPIPDLRLYVIDPGLLPVPPGVAGELCVGGAGLARGYLGRPALTAERFVPDPFGPLPGERLYRSGDLVRHSLDGDLEYLGRIDSQVKIRGFRIELGEVEAALSQHPAVREAAVLARTDGASDARLVACLVPAGDEAPTVQELRGFLQGRLPEHCVPAAFVVLDALPLTDNGKLDRRKLAAQASALETARPDLGEDYVAPRDERERTLAEIWAQVLGVERVGVHDNFFALGGDSIRSIQVIAQARGRGLELSIQQIFQHPTVAEMAAALGGAPTTAPAPAVRTHPFELVAAEDRRKLPEGLEDAYPLSRLQAGMLFHMDLHEEAPPYHNVESFHLRTPFALEPFREAVRRVVARHAVLRTSFNLTSYSEPLQLVHREAEMEITVEDLRGLDTTEQERRVDAWLDRERRRPFDLSRAPQLRFHIQLRSDAAFQLTFTENHAIFDGWSLYSSLTEIFRHFSALLHGRPLAEEPPPPIPFREFIALEREALRSEEARAFWLGLLGEATFLALPRWRVATPGAVRMHTARTEISRETSDGLVRLAASAGIPLKSVLLAAHAKVLARACGQPDVLTGLVMNGRAEVEGGEQTRGLFLNTLPFRLVLPGGTWSDLGRAAFAAEQATLPHRRFPLAELQNVTGGRALFETIFNYTHFHVVDEVVESGEVALLGFKKSTDTNFTLTAGFAFDPAFQKVTLELAGDTAELPREQIEALAGWYGRALAAMAADPGARHEDADLLAPAERLQILLEWNDTAAAFDAGRTIHELIEASAARDSEAVAVVAEDGTLTYGALNRRANQLARHLRRLGVGPGALVGVHLERSAAMIPALLGILKSGGAYVPLSDNWPEARMEWVLGVLGVRCLVTQTGRLETAVALRRNLPALTHAICVDDGLVEPETEGLRVWTARDLEALPEGDLAPLAGPEDLAYIIFTSGSTGHPKGVVVRHRPVVNLIDWVGETCDIGPDDRVLFITSLTFDLSVYDVFGLLAAGGSIRVASATDLAEPERLVRILRDEPVTFWDSAPAALQQLVPLFAGVSGLEQSRLRLVFLSGDWIPLPLPDLIRESFPSARVIGLGGATEATVWSNWFPIGEVDRRWASIPYGRPIRNARYHVLDEGLMPCPVGAPGDLYIAGTCLSDGYAQEPILTARSYVPDPFGEEPGGRLYRTGDRARYGPSGLLEFLGRLDSQVKIRGYRIELGEIEAVLARHEGVRDPVVLAREDVPGQRRLVAYFVPRWEPGPDAAALRDFLAAELPDYMLPAVFVPLEALPVTANGKLDRAALPVPEIDRSRAERQLVAPRTPLERNLAAAWEEILGAGAVGVHDNFFELGGHSLLAIQLVTRLRESLRVDLPLRALFDSPTVAELAERIAALRGQGPAVPVPSALPRVVPEPERLGEPFPLTDLQQAYWLGQRTDFDLGGVSAHIYEELEVPNLDVESFESAWRRLIERHPMLRMVVLPDGRQQILDSVPPFQVEILDLRGLESERAEAGLAALRARMAEQGPDTSRWPLFEVALSRFDDRARIHVSLSLLVSDALSGQVLTRELIRFYADPLAELPPLAVTYRDLVVATRAFEDSEAFQASLAYWRERLPDLPPAPSLPVATEGLRRATFARRTWALESAGWTRLQARAARAGVTPTVAILAIYAEVLAAWSRSRRFTLNILYFNRPPLHPQIEEIVGNFSSTLLLAVDASAREGFAARAQRLQERLWQDLEHGRVSGVRVLRELHRLHGANARPAMPVVFTSDLGLVRAESEGPSEEVVSHSSGALQTPQVWLDHQVSERGGRLILNWDVVEEVFPPGLIDDMFGAYCRLVAGLAEDEALWSVAPPLLTPSEQLALFAEANATVEPYEEGLLHVRFEAQAARSPEAPAVFAPDRTLTYGELSRLSRRIARRLRDLGARPDTLVAVVMEKGWEQIVAVLGVLQSGAAYLPIDPSVPAERLRSLLANGEVSVALTQPHFLDALDWPAEVRRLTVDPSESGEDAPLEPLETPQRPERLAYVIFTSGSTGQPKGVAIEHRAALNTVLDVNRRFTIGAADRVLALSALNFDLSVWDVFGPLSAGGAIVLPGAGDLREPGRWLERMRAHRVTVWNSVPALLEMLVDHLEDGGDPAPPELRLALLSGDWIPVRLPDRLRALVPEAEVVSLGGATEASIWSILHPIGEVDPRWTSIPYGRPMANQRFHVLGEHLEPRPLWVPGELYIGGIGLAREYWRDEARSGASFFAHPETGERLYRTGDLGRWRPDGFIEFLGREDLQVKVQGYRIELGEIEAALAQHPAVRACVVAALGAQRESKRLVAYVVSSDSEDAEELRDFLAGKLPAYMVPSAFVVLEALPLTPNGKVDRGALPEPERLARKAVRVPPRDDQEARLAAIWEDLLGLAPIGVHDDFFDLGGHSLLAVRLMARLRTGWEVDLPISTLFEAGTIESLAALLRHTRAGGTGAPTRSPLVEIRRGEGTPLFLVHPVGGSVLCYRELARALGGTDPVWGLEAEESAEARTLEEMATSYLRAVREIWPRGPYRLGGWSMGGTVAFEMARQLRQSGQEVDLVILIDPSAPGAHGPLAVDEATLASWFAHDLGGLAGIDLDVRPEELRGLDPEAEAERLLELAREARALPPGLEADEVRRRLAVFRRNYQALLAYSPGGRGIPLALLVAEQGTADVAPWLALEHGDLDVERIPGDHYSIVRPPAVQALAARLRACLDAAAVTVGTTLGAGQ